MDANKESLLVTVTGGLLARFQSEKYSNRCSKIEPSLAIVAREQHFFTSSSSGDTSINSQSRRK